MRRFKIERNSGISLCAIVLATVLASSCNGSSDSGPTCTSVCNGLVDCDPPGYWYCDPADTDCEPEDLSPSKSAFSEECVEQCNFMKNGGGGYVDEAYGMFMECDMDDCDEIAECCERFW